VSSLMLLATVVTAAACITPACVTVKGAQVWEFSSHGFFKFFFTLKSLWVGDFRAKVKFLRF
jgi:hypothetical protein